MTFDDEEEPKDWEAQEEEPPERLQKKWEQEEIKGPRRIVCPSCKKETPRENLACIFCGAVVPQGNGPVRCFLTWAKRLFGKS